MINISIIILSVIGFATYSVCTRFYQIKVDESTKSMSFYHALLSFTAFIIFFAMNGELEMPEKATLFYGIIYGIFFSGAIISIAFAFIRGSMSLASTIVNTSLVIPITFSSIFYDEKMTVLQFIGLVLIFITMILSGLNKDEKGKKASARWFLFVLIAFICNGSTAVLQKQYKLSFPEGQAYLFMAISYLTTTIIFSILFLLKKENSNNSLTTQKLRKILPVSLISGLGSCTGNIALMHLSTKVSAAVLYPSVNGGLSVMVVVFAILMFKEKITLKKLLAIVIGIIAIVVLSI